MSSESDLAPFFQAADTFSKHVNKASGHLEVFGLSDELEEIEQSLEQEEFRIAVLGRFKAGKSSVVNALLDREVSPTETVACTSSLIELKDGDSESFRFSEEGENWEATTEEEFRRGANLREDGGKRTGLARWRIRLPIDWLDEYSTLVDTPGTDEDEVREKIAYSELRRADAALIVIRADQPVGLGEGEMAERLKERVDHVLVVVNQMDVVPEDEREEVLDYLKGFAEEIGIPERHVLPLSAKEILEGRSEAEADLHRLQRNISEVLAADKAGARLRKLMRQTYALMDRLEHPIEAQLNEAEKQADEAEKRTDELSSKLDERESFADEVQAAFRECGRRAATSCSEKFRREWSSILQKLQKSRTNWSSDHDPLFSPKKTAEDLAGQAEEELEQIVSRMTETELQPIIERHTEEAQESVQEGLDEILTVASEAGLGSAENLQRQLVDQAMQDAFGETIEDASEGAAISASITAALSMIVGYIVADIVLFYILGAIAGFLNPVLLAAAAATGVTTYVFMGKETVHDYLRDQIAEKLGDELGQEETVDEITSAVREAVREQFGELAEQYATQIEQLISRTRDELKEARAEKDERQENVAEILEHRREASEALDRLKNDIEESVQELESIHGGDQ
jgi:signal recognition particle receptor subunit beta